MKSLSKYQSGAVSLFVVIFATLLITVITVSFLRLMVNDQRQATSNDLSQSAYDSAQAGVEDAKRALIQYQKICTERPSDCNAAGLQIDDQTCNKALSNAKVIPAGTVDIDNPEKTGEVRVNRQATSNEDDDIKQFYTCVKIQLQTDDYIGSLSLNESKLVPLVGTSAFNTVNVEWFSTQDMSQSSTGSYALNLPGPSAGQQLIAQTSWPSNRPSVLRTQLMQYANTFTLSSFDFTSSSQSNANTLFLYPTSASTASDEAFVARDPRKTDPNGDTPADQRTDTPLPIHCESNLSAGGYACSAKLVLPDPVGGDLNQRRGFLRLTPFFNASHFRVTLLNGVAPVQFDSVQPEIDSTGRANDLFRRVASRVDLIDTSFPYPEAAIDLTGNLCKDFAVTDNAYIASGSCNP